ncbi:MAG: efflux RND transporter permease subunit [Prevotella sp.]
MINKIIGYFLHNRIMSMFVLIAVILGGLATAPFNWDGGILPRNPVPVDAIPDIGDNQQIIATEWMGHSPKDIQDQVTYPLTTALLGVPGVKTVRSTSMFGMSFIYIIFKDNVEFYWSRSRILEKLNSLPAGLLPEGVKPALGPDATGLGQIYWYTLEGRNPKTGKPTGGWDPQELRTIQDYYVRYSLGSADGVSQVSSVGGYVKEYQVDLDPDAMRSYGLDLIQIMKAVKNSNIDVGAGTMEINQAEYLIRGLGFVKNLKDLEDAVITSRNNVPIRVKDVAKVSFGPGTRRGGLDKEGQEAVGGVVVARNGSNPMEVINNVKSKIKDLSIGLPEKTLKDGTVSKVTVIPFYDRSQLIKETIGTLESSLTHEVLICIIVVLILVLNIRASVVIATILPLAVLLTFVIMKFTGIEANIVALSGIAIAIGVMVDVGVVFMENVVRKLDEYSATHGVTQDGMPVEPRGQELENVILSAVGEVSSAIMTGMGTTVISFLPVFAMQAQEGKMFHPLAFTKTFALMSALILGLVVLPTLAYWIFSIRLPRRIAKRIFHQRAPRTINIGGREFKWNVLLLGIIVLWSIYILTGKWLPLGPDRGMFVNILFVAGIIGIVLAFLWSIVVHYERILRWCLNNRLTFMILPVIILVGGIAIWKNTGSEFMPTLNEGTFLLMPTSMPHSGVEANLNDIKMLDTRIKTIPEVESAVGKWGRAESALDPAPIQMYETTINYLPEYMLDESGQRARFKTDFKGRFELKGGKVYDPSKAFRIIPRDSLIASSHGDYFRQWRKKIRTEDDIWKEITAVTNLPGLTGSPKLQPIATRQVMLSTGLKAPMGLKIYGPDLTSIEKAGLQMEKALKEVNEVNKASVFYDRTQGAPYIEISPDREKIARYGIQMGDIQSVIETAIGGMPEGNTVEGRERFPIRVRYARELHDDPEALKNILVPAANGAQIPLGQLATFHFVKGATMITAENTFLVGYITFDKLNSNLAEVDVVNKAQAHLDNMVAHHQIDLPKGVTYKFTGTYEQQIHASQRLMIVIPIALLLILLVLYFQFQSITASLIHFSGVFVAFAGGFILMWLYGQSWFLNFSIDGVNMRTLFDMGNINLSVAVWVGFIALFGIATNDGVIMGTYIHQVFKKEKPNSKEAIKEAVIEAGLRRVRPACMTTAVTLIALLPVLSSTGKGSDIMVPMSIPTFGGMLIQTITMFIVPVLQCWWRESALKRGIATEHASQSEIGFLQVTPDQDGK